MKIVIDENLPPALARALQALFDKEHEIKHMRDMFDAGTKDIPWIEALSREGRWVVISADRRITRNQAEYDAFRRSKLIGFFFSRGLAKSKLIKQAERVLVLWESITSLGASMEGGAVFELPMTSTRIRQMAR